MIGPISLVDSVNKQIVSKSVHRVRLEIWTAKMPIVATNNVLGDLGLWVAPNVMSAVGQGIAICQIKTDGSLDVGVPPRSYQLGIVDAKVLVLDIETHGDIVQMDWHAFGNEPSGGLWLVAALETIDDDCGCRV
jgi:hypothetical protein